MHYSERPDPDRLLEAVQLENPNQKGHLKIYLGMAAGVGKTYAMLSDAVAQKERGQDVVVGYLEHHGRIETESLADHLEVIPAIQITVSSGVFREMDLDGILQRKPSLVVVDELAHTNASSLRHTKRWQDVDELLRAGINVLTTVNIQHVESLQDVVSQITGVQVQETIPDQVISKADDIEVIDIPPRELIERIKEGKVYPKERIVTALNNFFIEGNLIALRELVLRQGAERVDAQMRHFRLRNSVKEIWPTTNRIMVCVGPSPTAEKLVRAAKRLSESMQAGLVAVSLESSQYLLRSEAEKTLATDALELARTLGAEIVVKPSQDMVEDLVLLGSEKNVTGIVIGKSLRSKWKDFFSRSLVDELLLRSERIDIHVLSISPEKIESLRQEKAVEVSKLHLISSLLTVAAVTAICQLLPNTANLSNIIMFYLLACAWIAFRYSRVEAFVSSLSAVLAFDFFFVPPRLTFSVSDAHFLPTFGVMLSISLLISSLTLRLKSQSSIILKREQRALLLAELSKELLSAKTPTELGAALSKSAKQITSATAHLILKVSDDLKTFPPSALFTESEKAVASWCFSQGLMAGKSTNTLPGSQGLYLPILSDHQVIALLGLYGEAANSNDLQTLSSISNQISLALKRLLAEEQSTRVQLEAESEKLRNTLLSSISHDLRTPLAAIEGAASTLLDKENLDLENRLDLSRSILEQSGKLHSLIRNVLNLTKLETGNFRPNSDWHSLEELLGISIANIKLQNRIVNVNCSPSVDLVYVDGLLIGQVFQNLIENFISHAGKKSSLSISVTEDNDLVTIRFSDNGPGIGGAEERIFEKLYRPNKSAEGGFGLGLAICRAIMKIHGGSIYAKNNVEGGVSFFVVLPRVEQPSLEKEIEE